MDTYTLPDLPYEMDALEPHYNAKFLELHHDKHQVLPSATFLVRLKRCNSSSTTRLRVFRVRAGLHRCGSRSGRVLWLKRSTTTKQT